jgi:hypothetical protein
MRVIQDHADWIKRKLNSVPSQPSCGLGAWFGTLDKDTDERGCANVPAAATAFHSPAEASDPVAIKLAADLVSRLARPRYSPPRRPAAWLAWVLLRRAALLSSWARAVAVIAACVRLLV